MNCDPTGVEIVDHVLGGITPGLPCVVSGPSGAGRTVLSLQLAASALAGGSIVSLLCNEPAPFLLQQAATLGFDFDDALRSGQFVLLELDPRAATLVRAHGIGALVSAVREEEPLVSTMIVDPFTAITAEIMDEPQLRSTAREFVKAASPMRIVLTLEAERVALQPSLERVLSEICGSYLSLHRSDDGERRLKVEKTRSGIGSAESVGFSIGEGGTRRNEEPRRPQRAVPSQDAETPHAASGAELEARTEAPSPQREARETQAALDTHKTVLVVDHDVQSRNLLHKWLSDQYDIVTAEDGFEAMTTLLTRRPDLVILDLLMPRVSGYELLGAFQKAAPEIPMLVVSHRVSRPGDRLGPLVLGATDILKKPVERFELVHKVELLMRLEQRAAPKMNPADANALFGNISDSRELSAEEFRERLQRACTFGERYGLPSSLVVLSASSSEHLDGFIAIANENLRFEDALLRVSARRVVLLLVATEPGDAGPTTERLCDRFCDAAGGKPKLQWMLHGAQPVDEGHDWRPMFRGIASGPKEEG